MKYLIDVDTGIDDALGLMLLFAKAKSETLGVLTVSGNVGLDQATLNTQKVLSFLSWDLPLYRGANRPLMKDPFDAADIHGRDGLAGQLLHVQPRQQAEKESAVEALIRYARQVEDLVYIATGPVTNLAMALESDPDLAGRLQAVVLMGGALDVPGNVTPTAEFNAYCDPEALERVFKLGRKVTIIGLDVTCQARLRASDLDKLKEGPVKELIKGLTADYMDRYEKRWGERAILLHDPLAVYTAAWKEGVISFEETGLDVDCEGPRRGSLKRRSGAPVNRFGVTIDEKRFITDFLEAMSHVR